MLAIQSLDATRAHGLGVKLVDPLTEPKPSTWTRWHDDESAARMVQLTDAYKAMANMHIGHRELTFNRNHWRLAAVFGWALVALLVFSGWGR